MEHFSIKEAKLMDKQRMEEQFHSRAKAQVTAERTQQELRASRLAAQES